MNVVICHTENLRCTPSGGDNILEWQLDGIQAADGSYFWGGANGVVLKKDSSNLCLRPWSGPAPGVGQTSCYDYDVTTEHLYQSACYRGDSTNIFGWELEECGSTPPSDAGTGGATCTF